jgi:rhamnose utilization protein RhaD (predicted bifunctional aldolase and dehydrogenase)
VLEPQHKGLLLGNHGLTVWGDSVDETEDLITRIENCWRVGATDNFPEKKTDFVGRAESHWIDALSKGILVPDEAVLLGPRAFYSGNDSLGGGIFFDEMNIGRPGTQLTEDAIDLARMLIAVGQHVKKDSELNYLTEEQVAELLDWDMEKFRQEMSK